MYVVYDCNSVFKAVVKLLNYRAIFYKSLCLQSLPIWFAMWLGIVVCEPPVPIPQYGVPFNPNGLPTQGGLPPQPLPPLKPPTDIGGPNYYNGNDIGGHGDHDHGQVRNIND